MSLFSSIRGLFRDRSNPFALPHVWYEGGDGSTPDGAIVVRGAGSDLEGVAATFGWMHEHLGAKDEGWRLVTHSTGYDEVRKIDTFVVILRDGRQKRFYFDVSESFGKPFRPS
ncbi:MAG TPA: hypothetical protein VEK37_05260 [Gemmatimonadaceae bacterium]|nr:hypothetical protein [Gemmatimonadaceae bacterium]